MAHTIEARAAALVNLVLAKARSAAPKHSLLHKAEVASMATDLLMTYTDREVRKLATAELIEMGVLVARDHKNYRYYQLVRRDIQGESAAYSRPSRKTPDYDFSIDDMQTFDGYEAYADRRLKAVFHDYA